jgi:hypothetical protein
LASGLELRLVSVLESALMRVLALVLTLALAWALRRV